MTAVLHRHWLSSGNLTHAPLSSKSDGGGTPPGSAGVPPACTHVACRQVSVRISTRPPCRRERHGPGRSRVLGPLPVHPGRRNGRGYARICAGGTPALPGELDSVTSSQQRRSIGLCVYRWFVFSSERQISLCLIRRAGRGPDLAEMQVWEETRWVRYTRPDEYLGQQPSVCR